jgi:hypothetical protein
LVFVSVFKQELNPILKCFVSAAAVYFDRCPPLFQAAFNPRWSRFKPNR